LVPSRSSERPPSFPPWLGTGCARACAAAASRARATMRSNLAPPTTLLVWRFQPPRLQVRRVPGEHCEARGLLGGRKHERHPATRRWVRGAHLWTDPWSDLSGSTELAEHPLVGVMRLPRMIRHRLGIVNGTRCTRKAVGSAPPAYPLSCRMLTLLVPSPRAHLPGMGEKFWIRAATWCLWPPRGDLVVEHTVGASAAACGQQNRTRTCIMRGKMTTKALAHR